MTPIALSHQIEQVRFAETRQRTFCQGGTVRDLRRQAERDFSLQALNAAARSLEVLKEHQDEVRAFLRLSTEAREAVLRHGNTMAEICLELAKREAIADAGGPVR
ncbi:hypothetical protein [Bosea sp. (in: a-proteobacteria)]|jgi:hypothetical protein|uniref:hypothetical protein n=1 Tax=Bosea sp. (in: a-proteobacteria) TaxID=1871050 RepID=UPI003564C6E3